MEDLIVTGKTDTHLVPAPGSKLRLHLQALPAFESMRKEASKAGFDLQIVSAFRSFADQLRIWNLKASGQRPVLDSSSQPIDIFSVSSLELVQAILRWSALPAASRHHWGTDIDVIDARALPPGYNVQLVPAEVEAGGMFAPLHDWLDENMQTFGFYRPYDKDRGGVSPERWHLSYFPVATKYFESISPRRVIDAWKDEDVQLRETVEKNIDEIFRRFVINVAPAPITAG